jgi:hypothetical protein
MPMKLKGNEMNRELVSIGVEDTDDNYVRRTYLSRSTWNTDCVLNPASSQLKVVNANGTEMNREPVIISVEDTCNDIM